MQLVLALLLLAIVLFTAFLVGRMSTDSVAPKPSTAAAVPATTTAPTPASTTSNVTPQAPGPVNPASMFGGSGLTAQQVESLNSNFRAAGCQRFSALELQLALNRVPAGRLVFNLGNLASVSPAQISQFVVENKRRFPFFVEYCNGQKTTDQFVSDLRGWVLNPLNKF
jgi:hypothetical protein